MKGRDDVKIKIVLAAILAIGTLMGITALVSAVHKADHGTTHTSSVWHQPQELTRPAV
jgi:hypothetical protein